MKQKELTKIFMMISNWKKLLSRHSFKQNYFSVVRVNSRITIDYHSSNTPVWHRLIPIYVSRWSQCEKQTIRRQSRPMRSLRYIVTCTRIRAQTDSKPPISSATTWTLFSAWPRILVQVTIYRRLLIGRDGHLDQSELVREYGPYIPWTSLVFMLGQHLRHWSSAEQRWFNIPDCCDSYDYGKLRSACNSNSVGNYTFGHNTISVTGGH